MTVSALLSDVVERLETEQRWCDIEVAYERMQREDPDGWGEYLGELAEWRASTTTVDTAAVHEWPDISDQRCTTSEGWARSNLVSDTGPDRG
jgi:hypothetical protein